MIHLLWPWMLAALPAPWIARRLLPPAPVTGGVRLPFAAALGAAQQAADAGGWRVHWPAMLAWALLVLAASRPAWVGDPVELPAAGRDLLLAVDISGSMDEADMRLGGQRVNRLQAVQDVAGDFIERRRGDRIGLILFGDQAYLYSPLSLDRDTVATLLADAAVGLAGQKTAIGDAIGLGVKRLRDSPAEERVLILLTDGVNTAGEVDPDKAAELAQTAGVRVHTIGFGAAPGGLTGFFTLQQAQIDERQLQRIADTTGGRYFRGRDTAELRAIYQLLDEIEPVDVDARTFRPQRSLFHWPLAAAVLLVAALAARRLIPSRDPRGEPA